VTRSTHHPTVAGAVVCALALTFAPAAAQTPQAGKAPASSSTDLDAFMEQVLKRREVNRQTLEQYVLDEVEQFEVLGPSRMPVYKQKREYTWYVRDGLHVRSPLKFDGVTVGDDARKDYEDHWAHSERERLKRAAEKEKNKDRNANAASPEAADAATSADQSAGPSGASPIPTPRFVSEAYFMDFKFEPGNYYLVGREDLEGHRVLRIEYYPKRMFDDDDDRDEQKAKEKPKETEKESRRERRDREMEQRIDRQMNKTALVTLWVDPAEHQIVKYTFDNVWMDFLPAGWLVKIDDIRASMTMGQPFPGVWLPREMNIHAGVTMAAGSLEAAYARTFSDYKQADVATKIRIPKQSRRSGAVSVDLTSVEEAGAGPFVPEDGQQAEIVNEIRVHGNAYVRDEEVIRLAGVTIGQTLAPDALRQIEQRLEASGVFDTIEVRKRYRSLDNETDVALVLLVHERPGFKAETVAEHPGVGAWARMKNRLMFLPILDYDDGYGFTYGGRVSTINLLGAGERLSVPLTWGGTRRAAVEVDRTFRSGPLTRVASTFGIWQRENPRFEIDDQRVEWTARAERSFARIVRAGVTTSQSTVDFGALNDRLWTIGAEAALDTRGDPAFPRNAVLLGGNWNVLHVRRLDEPINQYTTDARGYLGVIRQAVLAARVQYSSADRTLPPYERYLLGGASTLRGFETGSFDGDRLFVTSAELRVPLTSVLSGAKLGVSAFMDAGKVFDVNQRMKDAAWHQGVGAGVFLIATIVRINVDVAHGLRDGDTRVHLSSGFSF
jgi:hypothetical protein